MPPICETMIKGGPCPGTSIKWHPRQHLYLCGFHHEQVSREELSR